MNTSPMSSTSFRSTLKRLVPRSLLVQRLNARGSNAILLTFDDGPHATVTPAVLDRLDAFQARAIFFIIGHRATRAPGVLEEIRRRGHVVANHTYHHRADDVLADAPRPGFRSYFEDSRQCQAMIEPHVPPGLRLFRPPGGRLTPTTLIVPKLLGLRSVGWSLDVGDWAFRTATESRAGTDQLLRLAGPRDIVLLHDDNPMVLEVLDGLLPELQRRRLDLASGLSCL